MPTHEKIKKRKLAELEAATSSASNIARYFQTSDAETRYSTVFHMFIIIFDSLIRLA